MKIERNQNDWPMPDEIGKHRAAIIPLNKAARERLAASLSRIRPPSTEAEAALCISGELTRILPVTKGGDKPEMETFRDYLIEGIQRVVTGGIWH